MERVNVDINQGKFVTYPDNEILLSIKGTPNKAFYKMVGQRLQLKVVIYNKEEDKEYLINSIVGNVTNQSLVTTLIENRGDVELYLEYNNNGQNTYFLVKNKE